MKAVYGKLPNNSKKIHNVLGNEKRFPDKFWQLTTCVKGLNTGG